MEGEVIRVPRGIEKYKDIDLKLLPNERVERIVTVSPLSKMRGFILCGLLALFGFLLYTLFSMPKVTIQALVPPTILFLIIYFVWNSGEIEGLKSILFKAIKYIVALVIISYILAYITSYLEPIVKAMDPAVDLGFSTDPIENIWRILSLFTSLINVLLMPYAPILRIAALGLSALSLILIALTYLECRGTLYYVTDRRVVVRRKFGTVQVTTLPLDGLVEVTAFQGFFGRIFGYGDIVLSMVSGGGVADSLAPQPVQPTGAFYQVKRRLEGVRNVWELKDLIIMLRDRYVEAIYLERIEGEVRRIREAVTGEKKATIRMGREEKETIQGRE